MPANLNIGTASGNKEATEIHIGTATGNKLVTEGWVGTVDGNKQFFTSTTIYLANASIGDIQFDPSPATAQFWLKSDGVAYRYDNTLFEAALYNWCVPSSAVGDYEARATLLSGSVSGGSSLMDTWLSLGTDRNWRADRAVIGGAYASILVEIRQVSSGTTVASATIDLEAEVTIWAGG